MDSHFIASIQTFGSNICLTNHHLFILDGHNLHVTLGVVHKTIGVQLDLITLPSHTSHALQLLNVFCFKPFKITLKFYKGVQTLTNKNIYISKEDLAQWVSFAFKKTLTPTNICKGFSANGIWHLNLYAMASKI